MDVATRENGVIAGCVVVAVIAWYALEEFTTLGDAGTIAVLVGIGIFLPLILLDQLL